MKRRKGLTEGEKKTRGGENGETGFIEISRGKVKEERKREGGKKPDQKWPSGGQSRRRKSINGNENTTSASCAAK